MDVFKLIRKLEALGVEALKLSFTKVEEHCVFGSFIYKYKRFNIDVFEKSIVISCFSVPNDNLFHECDSIKELIQILKEV